MRQPQGGATLHAGDTGAFHFVLVERIGSGLAEITSPIDRGAPAAASEAPELLATEMRRTLDTLR